VAVVGDDIAAHWCAGALRPRRARLKRTSPSVGSMSRRQEPLWCRSRTPPTSATFSTADYEGPRHPRPARSRSLAEGVAFPGKCFFSPRAASRISFGLNRSRTRTSPGRDGRRLSDSDRGEELRLVDPTPIEGESHRGGNGSPVAGQEIGHDSRISWGAGRPAELLALRRNVSIGEDLSVRMKRVAKRSVRVRPRRFPGVT